MKTQSILFGTVGLLVVAMALGCGKDNRSAADRSADNTTAASPSTPPADDWTLDRDSYIARRQQDLDEMDRQWDIAKDKATKASKKAWNEVKEQTTGLRHDLDEAKNATKETWDTTKQKLDNSWDRIKTKSRDVFGNESHGS